MTLSVALKSKEELYAANMPFVKDGGLFIATSADHPLGTPVRLQLELMEETEVFHIEGKVIWKTPLAAQGNMTAGVGVQFTAEKYFSTPVYPGVNTCFMGATEDRGLWTERCQGCGQCILARTGGICPVSRCAKRVMNGPCGGSTDGKCEINKDVICAWQLIVERLKALDRFDDYETLSPLKDWSTDRAGGPRKVVREDVQP